MNGGLLLFVAALLLSLPFLRIPRKASRRRRRTHASSRRGETRGIPLSRETEVVRDLRIAKAELERRLVSAPKANFREPRTKALLFRYLAILEERLRLLGIDPARDASYLAAAAHRLRSSARALPSLPLEYID